MTVATSASPAAPTLEEQAKLYERANRDYAVPDNATLRCEYVKCGRTKCRCKTEGAKIHGPYFYAYWKENGKLRKRYVGKSSEDYDYKARIRTGLEYTYGYPVGVTSNRRQINQWKKIEFIFEKEKKYEDDDVIKKYADRYNRKLITCDWAYKMIKKRCDRIFWERIFKVAKKQGIKIRSGWTSDKKYYINWNNACRNYCVRLMKDNDLKTVDELENWADSYLNS